MISTTSSSHRRTAMLSVTAILVALALVAGTWLAATRFQSSAQREAAAQPPPAQPIVVDIVRTDLVERTTMKATAARNGIRNVALPKPGATSVITRAGVGADEVLHSGQVVTWINDRPLLALRGPFPLYRDLGEGDSGEDVRMIQQALADLGYDINPDGTFGTWTAAQVRELFRSVGAEVATREKKADPADRAGTDAEGNKETDSRTGEASTNNNAGTNARQEPPAPQEEVVLRATETLILPELPAHVSAIPPVGTTLGESGSTLTLAGSNTTLTSEVPGAVAARLQVGRRGIATLGEQSIDVTIDNIAAAGKNRPGAQGEGAGTSAVIASESGGLDGGPGSQGNTNSIVRLTPVSGQLPANWAGKSDILITIDLSEPMMDVLVVPQRAIAVDASGVASILVEDGDQFTQVNVVQRACITGMCAIDISDTTTTTHQSGGTGGSAATLLREGKRARVDR